MAIPLRRSTRPISPLSPMAGTAMDINAMTGGPVSPLRSSGSFLDQMRQTVQSQASSQAFDQRMAAQDQRADQRYAAHDVNRSFNPLQWSTAGSGQQYAGQQAQALGYQQGVGINPVLAARSNFAADFNAGAGGAIGAGMAQRFGPRSPLGSPAGQPAGTYDMQVGGYGSPVEYRQINQATYGSPLQSREQQMLASGDRLGADAMRSTNAAKMEAQRVRQAAYRAANGGVSDAMRGRIRQQETKERRDLQQAGVSPLSAEASVIAPTLYQRAQQARANPVPASPLAAGGGVFAGGNSSPRTPSAMDEVNQFDLLMTQGGVDASGAAIPPSGLFARSLGISSPDDMTVTKVHDGLVSNLQKGIDMGLPELRELRQFAASRRTKYGDNGLSLGNSTKDTGIESYQDKFGKLWEDLASIPEDDNLLMQWYQNFKTKAPYARGPSALRDSPVWRGITDQRMGPG